MFVLSQVKEGSIWSDYGALRMKHCNEKDHSIAIALPNPDPPAAKNIIAEADFALLGAESSRRHEFS
jgi:hypothetical protein